VEREALRVRLEKLAQDEVLRSSYIDTMREIWAAAAASWAKEGKAAVSTEVRAWTRDLAEGAGYLQVLRLQHLWDGRPELDALADAASAQGRLTLTPCWFGGKVHVIELDGAVYAGRGMRHDERSYRKVAAEISSNIKALADPTRLAILLRLARQPASVTEVARQFELSQPTVSAHVQILRDAGLLEERQDGRSARLSANEEGLRRLFSSTEESLIRLFHS
jgi:DNA-binding transcriptional ArsR family regulator